MKRERGQILPFFLVSLPFLIFFIGASGEMILLCMEKTKNQRTADMLAMQATTDQSRALNAIAAINTGLDKINRNVTIYGSILTGLAACAATIWGAAICAKPYLTLLALTPNFLRRVRKLGKQFGDWQDNLVTWGTKTPLRTLQLFNLISVKDSTAWIYPTEPQLRIHRVPQSEFSNTKKCRKEHLSSLNLSGVLGKDDYYTLYYSTFNQEKLVLSHQKEPIKWKIRKNGKDYQLESVDRYRCRTFFDLLKKIKTLSPSHLLLPGKYILDDDFSSNRITVALVHHTLSTVIGKIDFKNLKEDEALAPLLSILKVKALRGAPHSSLSESTVIGESADEMSFSPELAAVTQDRHLSRYLAVDPKEIHEQIAH